MQRHRVSPEDKKNDVLYSRGTELTVESGSFFILTCQEGNASLPYSLAV